MAAVAESGLGPNLEPGDWCLQRVGEEARGERLELRAETEVTVGRGFGVTHRLLARNCPLMISRNHCAFHLTSEGQCTVIDNKSLNGVWVNRERIEPHQPYPLKEGDVIQLGVPLRDKERAEYEYRLARHRKGLSPSVQDPGLGSSVRNMEAGRMKRKHSREEAEPGPLEGPSICKTKIQRVSESHPLASGSSWEGQSSTAQRLEPSTAQRLESSTVERLEPSTSWERKVLPHTSLSGKLRTVSPAQRQSAQELTVLHERSCQIQVLSTKLQGLERQREPDEQTQQQLDGQLCSYVQWQQQQAEMLKRSFHKEQQQLERQELEAALSRQRKELQDVIRAKDRELEETKMKVLKDEAAAQLTDVLENELQCIICSEYFIEAVTLNCSHSFCCHCILEWRKRKEECPICRQTIQTQTRSVVLDNCIERMLESLSEAVRMRRMQLIKERKAMKTETLSVFDSESSSCDDLSSIQSISTVGSLDIENSEMEELNEEGELEENPIYYII